MKNTRSISCHFLISLLLNCCNLTIGNADEIVLNPIHPEKYTVMKNDTLWDISGRFLQHPWQWKALWENNPQIKNPHLIYPNDTLFFSVVNGKPQLSLSPPQVLQIAQTDKPCVLKPNEYEKGRKNFLLDNNNKVLPCARESEIQKPINFIPHARIATFLSSPKVVTEEELDEAPYVVGFHGGNLMAGTGDKVYVKGLTDEMAAKTYIIYRAGEIYRDADTNAVLGYEAKYIASATMGNNSDPATIIITKSTNEILQGDRIMPNPDAENIVNYFPKPPGKIISGHIIGVKDGMTLIGLYSVVVIDKGSADGLIIGHELTIYQKGKHIIDPVKDNADEIDLPDEISGKLIIFRPFEHLSYALVMKSKYDIHRLDKVGTN